MKFKEKVRTVVKKELGGISSIEHPDAAKVVGKILIKYPVSVSPEDIGSVLGCKFTANDATKCKNKYFES